MHKFDSFEGQSDDASFRYDQIYRDRPGEVENWENAAPEFLNNYATELAEGDNKAVLDVGCGSGRNLVVIAREGLEAYGIDVSGEGLKRAREALSQSGLQANLEQGTFYQLPYSDGHFKAAISNASLHDLPRLGAEKVFSEISRVLKEKGLFFCYVIANQPKGIEVPTHFQYYTEEDLRDLASENSFDIEEQSMEEHDDKRWPNGKRQMWKVVFRKKHESPGI